MTTKYQATAPDGTVFKRTTAGRSYSHCVVRRWDNTQWSPAEWRRTRELADALASSYRNRGLRVVVLEAVEVETKQAAAKRAADRVADHVDGYDRDDLGESRDY
jgi:hypothetical protein